MSGVDLKLPWAIDSYGSLVDASGRTPEVNGFANVCGAGPHQREARARAVKVLEAVNSIEAIQAERDRLREALGSVPIPGWLEPYKTFYARMDEWLAGPYRSALNPHEGEKG
jgi:hypothetical protein